MKKVLLAVALTLAFALFLTGTVAAQAVQYGTEVCVNASDEATARRLFPKASFHVIPDSPDPAMNGWRLVYGAPRSGGKIMTDAEEIEARRRESMHEIPGE
jgi:hypothetical protein